jgi:membrane protein DedA with SNARE-associated domain
MFDGIVSLISKGSYVGVLLLMLLENVFPPIPSELIMPLAGYLAERGEFNIWLAIAAGTVGSFAGQAALYYLGYRIGEDRLKRWAREHGHWVATSPEEIDRAQEWFDKHGGAAVFVGRMVPGIRSLISIPAGLAKMSKWTFSAYTLAGTAVWTVALTYAGRMLGQNYEKVEQYLNPISYAVVGFIVLSYLWRVFKNYRGGSEPSQSSA